LTGNWEKTFHTCTRDPLTVLTSAAKSAAPAGVTPMSVKKTIYIYLYIFIYKNIYTREHLPPTHRTSAAGVRASAHLQRAKA
jgi:hypothetical protein